MHVFSRRASLAFLALALAACSNGAGSSIAPSTVSDSSQSAAQSSLDRVLDSAPEVAGGHAVIHPLSIHARPNTPAILINFVSNGPAQGGVPCIACVYGASSNDTIGLTGPSSYIPAGASVTWQYSISFTDINYKGKCKVAWAITTSKKTLDSFSASFKLTSTGGFVLYALNRVRPKYSGPATLTGKATCGAEHPSLQAPLAFQ
ncbi:MAG: hypothetical protein WB609_10805 [Candidatus Cybelea sp.]